MASAAGSKEDRLNWFKSLEVKGDFKPETFDAYFKHVQGWLASDMVFVRKAIDEYRPWSDWTRRIAFGALGLAVLLPLPIFNPLDGWPDGVRMGYVAALVGGLVLMYDRVFNISNSWMRLTIVELQLKQVRYRLDIDWAKRRPLLTEANGATEAPALLDLLVAALDAAGQIIERQKTTWTSELSQAIDALRARLDADRTRLEQVVSARERERPNPTTGTLSVKIDKPQDLTAPLKLRVGSLPEESIDPVPQLWPVVNVPAGVARVEVEAQRAGANGGTFRAALPVPVVAGAIKEVTFNV
jgi:hypothetical protein